MRIQRLTPLCCALVLMACARAPRPSAPSVALELDFEHSVEPAAWIEVAHAATPAGITFVPGVEGQAARFDGSGASVDVTGVDPLPLTRAFTVELCLKVEDWKNPYGGSALLESVVSHSDDFTIAVLPTSWTYRASLRTSEGRFELAGGAVRLGAWQHVALVLDSEARMARLCVDGVVVDQREAPGQFSLQKGLPLRVGTWFKQNQAFCGAVDSLRIWERVLTASELSSRASVTRSKQPE